MKPATRTTTQVSATPTRTATAVSTSRVLTLSKIHSVRVTLRPEGGRLTVGGQVDFSAIGIGGGASSLSDATVDPSGTAVVTGRHWNLVSSERTTTGQSESSPTGSPIAAGVLPPGASDIGVILTTGEVASGLPVQKRLPDGRVIFAIKAQSARTSNPSKDSIMALTWTNADGTKGRKDVTQSEPYAGRS